MSRTFSRSYSGLWGLLITGYVLTAVLQTGSKARVTHALSLDTKLALLKCLPLERHGKEGTGNVMLQSQASYLQCFFMGVLHLAGKRNKHIIPLDTLSFDS